MFLIGILFLVIISYNSFTCAQRTVQGRFTFGISDHELVLPRKLKLNGAFHSFYLPHFFEENIRHKRSVSHLKHRVLYSVEIGGKQVKLDLLPNLDFISHGAIVEHRREAKNFSRTEIKRPSRHLCHFSGYLRNAPGQSNVAVSTCSGLTGFIENRNGTFFIEPLFGQNADSKTGEHIHVIFKRPASNRIECGVRDNRWHAWGEQLYKMNKSDRRQRSSSKDQRYIETMIVADSKFLEHHKDINVEEYILTIMNSASRFFYDPSLGYIINLVVVRIIYLYKDKSDVAFEPNRNATSTLKNFCKWQKSINPSDVNHPNHYDLALLITRHDLCDDVTRDCSSVGSAYVGSICVTGYNCIITEDTGLMLAITVAHQIGHALGCFHDSSRKPGYKNKIKNKQTVMSVIGNSNIAGWSKRCRDFVASLFNTKLGDCLINKPQDHKYKFSDLLPGAVYNYDQQCKFVYGYKFEKCITGYKSICGELWCKSEDSLECITHGYLIADGTGCSTNKWCFNGSCIEEGQRPNAIDGGWGDWGNWSSCSRSCGGGVRRRERQCKNPNPQNGGKLCNGKYTVAELCETTPCQDETISFRELQCREHNSRRYRGKTFKWKSYFPDPADSCRLICINEKKIIAVLEPRVKDGTRCKSGHKDTCIQGACIAVGCDWKIESGATEDICGVCNGDGTHCTVHNELYQEKYGYNYSKILTIPTGSVNVEIEELSGSKNIIAIGKSENEVYFNANFSENFPGEYIIGGVQALYTKPRRDTEELFIKGPLKEDITVFYVFLLANAPNPGVNLKWVIPSNKPTFQAAYHWEFLEWEECSVACGGGTQKCHPSCVDSQVGKVKSSFCKTEEKPETDVRICNIQPCKFCWKTFKWDECSGCLHKPGTKRRQVNCTMENPSKDGNGDETIVNDELCHGNKPPETEYCNSTVPCETKNYIQKNAEYLKTKEDLDYVHPYNIRGVNYFTSKYFKRNLNSGNNCDNLYYTKSAPRPLIVIDKINVTHFKLRSLNVKLNPQSEGDLSESVFEDEGDRVPKFVACGDEKSYKGGQAVNKLEKIIHQKKQINQSYTGNSLASSYVSISDKFTNVSDEQEGETYFSYEIH